jgi:hypothetical protein
MRDLCLQETMMVKTVNSAGTPAYQVADPLTGVPNPRPNTQPAPVGAHNMPKATVAAVIARITAAIAGEVR